MGGLQNSSSFFKDKPVFGLDIGFSTVKVMQVETHGKNRHSVVGYGFGNFDNKAIQDGIIVEPTLLATSINELFEKNIVGHINTRRVVSTIPATRTFTKTLNLPPLRDSELSEAVRMEAEQYIPIPLDDLYLDYSLIRKDKNGTEVLVVAVPKKIVDSHLDLMYLIGLEPVAFDTSIGAAGRLFNLQNKNDDIPAVLIDFGSISADVTIYDKAIIVTSTVPSGGDTFTELVSKKLDVTPEEGYIIKTKYGLAKSKKQAEILEALSPSLEKLVKEIKRMIRYYEERSDSNKKIGQVVTMGGGANMPGLSDYLTSTLRLPVRMCDPWQQLELGRLKQPPEVQKAMYVTSAGLSLVETGELFS